MATVGVFADDDEIGRSSRLCSFRISNSSLVSNENLDELQLQWAAVERLPTFERMATTLFDNQMLGDVENDDRINKGKKTIVNVAELGLQQRHLFIQKLIQHIEHDNLSLLLKLRKRIDKVGVQLPTIQVRYKNLSVEAECKVVHGKPLPTLWNTAKTTFSGFTGLCGLRPDAKISIIKDISGIIKPGRMTLLLGPPGCGKTTFLLALSGRLAHSLKTSGEVSYNGYTLHEFVPQKTAAYISQHDMHIPEMTVREAIDFSARCQGIGSRAVVLKEVTRKEKQAGIVPDPDVDAYMKAISVEGLESNLQTDYILKILGLDICADTMAGDAMRRGISGGQKKRLTTGEMMVGPNRALFMDEISNGLDSSTTLQIVSCLQHLVHITDATALISLLQPAPETFDLFDDVILMAEGQIVYHGPRSSVCSFFEDCGFRCPERKGVADFLQEVISVKDQAQYWHRTEQPYSYVSVEEFITKFKESEIGRNLSRELSKPLDKSKSQDTALSFSNYSLTKWDLLKACSVREYLLLKRNSFIYVFKSVQLVIISSVAMTVLLRTRLGVDVIHANDYMGALFYALVMLLVDGFPELQMTVSRLPVFFKQRELYFYPAWAYAIPASILKLPLSLLEAFIWTSLTYYTIGFSPEAGRFFRHFLLLLLVHLTSTSMFRFVASLCQTIVTSMTAGSVSILMVLLFGGFVIPKPSMPSWLSWGFWISPLTYGEIALTLNEFLSPRWEKGGSANITLTLGQQTLESRGFNYDSYFYWIAVGALLGMTVLFNIGFTLALTFLKPPGNSPSIISMKKYLQLQGKADGGDPSAPPSSVSGPRNGRMVLPFEPLVLTFQDIQYYIDTPVVMDILEFLFLILTRDFLYVYKKKVTVLQNAIALYQEMRKRGVSQKKLQLISHVTAAFKPGILTALMGVSGAGKTTLMDVLSGRKTGGTIEGDIRIGGYPKVQDTFSRISGYCEQTDIHSPQITVQESIVFSAWLRLSPEIDSKTKSEFVTEVLETIELDELKDSLVGMPGVSGLSTEQRKRLTIAVELVANPSIIFMDEPTSGLDARAAAIVMRAVKNVVDTGRTVVCTIHQPSIDIFESFDELILMKNGGRITYFGPLGQQASKVIQYFESIPGVPKIKGNYNPATWMLEVTSVSSEAKHGIDFGHIYEESNLCKENKELVKQLSAPVPGSKDLHFRTRFAQNGWEQLKACLWKQNLSYWRSPAYNLMRILYILAGSFMFGLLFWKQGSKIDTQQDLFNVLGSIYVAVIFFGINNCSTVLPFVATERTVLYRERFAGMYSSWAYSFAQVLVEIPYLFIEAIIYVTVTYPMIGYSGSPYKIFWFLYAMFCSLLSFNYLGMLLVALTPNIQLAAILASSSYTMLTLFAGFIVPKAHIPKWWLWLYYSCPTSWVLNGMLTSQYGDVSKEIVAFGNKTSVGAFLEDYFGYYHNFLVVVGVVLIIFPIILASLFAYCIGRLNFLRR